MRIDKVYIKKFKNLIDFSIDLDEQEMKTVLLGQNATGKSNFIEALVLIFKYLDLQKEPPKDLQLQYQIEYFCRNNRVKISYIDGKYSFAVAFGTKKEAVLKQIGKGEFWDQKDTYLPKYVFCYYSGISDRLKDHFNEHQKQFYDGIIKTDFKDNDIDHLRRLFYVQMVHSHFVLLSYYSFDIDKSNSIKFLRDILGIEDLESILFVLRKPRWHGKGDVRFFGAEGLVRKFLEKVWDLAIAPIYHTERVAVDFRSSATQERLYLYIKDKENLQQLAKYYHSNTGFFKALESTYISDLIEEVRVKVKKRFVDGSVTFNELSEGEQQLLTVLGLLKFTKAEESLILLDEPDTHLNPIWKWRYLEFLDQVVKNEKSTQILINTHDPLVIGGLTKEQVRIFRMDKEGKIFTEQPEIDPKDRSVAGILKSELFGLPSLMSKHIEDKLNRKRYLQTLLNSKQIKKTEIEEYNRISRELDGVGFYDISIDSRYNKFVEMTSKHKVFQKSVLNAKEEEELNRISLEVVKDILK